MKQSLKEKLLERFELNPGVWFAGGKIEAWVTANTDNTASNARRRLREMVEDGILKQKEEVKNGVNHAYYLFDPDDTTKEKKKYYKYVYDPYRKCMVESVV